jgi:hypothetical protein
VNSITETENEELITKVNELLGIVKGKETHVNAITNANVEDVDFIARNPYMSAWKSQNYGSNFQKNYSNPEGNPNPNNNSNNGVSGSNLAALESSLIYFMNSQNEQNKVLMKIIENHDILIAKLSNQAVSMKSDMQDLQERTKTVEAQLGKIAESQTLILARFAGKPEPKLVEEVKMMKVDDEKSGDLDYSNAPTPDYSMEDIVKIITLKNPTI